MSTDKPHSNSLPYDRELDKVDYIVGEIVDDLLERRVTFDPLLFSFWISDISTEVHDELQQILSQSTGDSLKQPLEEFINGEIDRCLLCIEVLLTMQDKAWARSILEPILSESFREFSEFFSDEFPDMEEGFSKHFEQVRIPKGLN